MVVSRSCGIWGALLVGLLASTVQGHVHPPASGMAISRTRPALADSRVSLRSVASEMESELSSSESFVCTSTFCDEVCTCRKVETKPKPQERAGGARSPEWAPKPLRRSSSVTSELHSNSHNVNTYDAAHSQRNHVATRKLDTAREFTKLQANLFPHIEF